ncbi:MAG: hypothetical protein DRI90_06765 [Deltaproteobacteria bacterium]|nr:MAG: hypothetical protein DRI90_06765 [Deltaproteobacteria bacterium]
MLGSPPAFEEILSSQVALPGEQRYRNLAELLFTPRPQEKDDRPILMGTLDSGSVEVSLRQLRHAAVELIAELARRGIGPGDTVALVRLPHTSDVLVALSCVALSVWGVRTLLPMYLELDRFGQWLQIADCKAVLWSAHEVDQLGEDDGERDQLRRLTKLTGELGLGAYCLHQDLQVAEHLRQPVSAGPSRHDALVATLIGSTSAETETLLLTTSGTAGRAKLVRYRQGAFLRSCAAWEAAGLFRPDRLGGRELCPLLSHSMGVRALWNALWRREALCLITPEWFLEHPERVRSILLQMRPAHMTGGPASMRTLLELGRIFPQLKDSCFSELRTVVSSGAPFDEALRRKLWAALGIRLENAFGTTETQQVCSTLVAPAAVGAAALPSGEISGSGTLPSLGDPLPGVRLGLVREPDRGGDIFQLWISSPFGFAGYLGDDDTVAGSASVQVESDEPFPWVDSGDLVERCPDGLRHVGRRKADFIKDGFGVKIAGERLAERYSALGPEVEHVECFALREEPGLAAVVFLAAAGEGVPSQAGAASPVELPEVLGKLRRQFEALHERLHESLELFEFRHLTVRRFCAIAAPAPRTAKGTVARVRLEQRLSGVIELMTGPTTKHPAVVELPLERYFESTFVRFASPQRGALLRLAKLDKHYRQAKGDRLVTMDQGKPVEVIDFVGGFGGNLLGHGYPQVLAAATEALSGDAIALWDQGAARPEQGELARRLALQVGRFTGETYVVRFGSTGAEAVEMALAHAVLEREERLRRLVRDQKRRFGGSHPVELARCLAEIETRIRTSRPTLLAIEGAFHGHSLGARAVLHHRQKRAPLESLIRIVTVFLPPDGSADVDAIVQQHSLQLPALALIDGRVEQVELPFSGILAAIAEPILGEGGVREVSPALLRQLAQYDFPLIADEIQCGLGRSGRFLASAGAGAHYYLFAKALGGGVAKISALLVERSRYLGRLDGLYSTTFGGDAFSCRVATAVIDAIERDDVPARARDRGAVLGQALSEVQQRYPDVLRPLRGRGLLWGVEIDSACVQQSVVLRALQKRERLGALAAAYLLNEHRIRTLPTLSAFDTLRIEPSAFVDDGAVEQLCGGLTALCQHLRSGNLAGLLGFLVREEQGSQDGPPSSRPLPSLSTEIEAPAEGAICVAFLNHFALPEREIAMAEPSLAGLSLTARRALFERLMALLELRPMIAFARNLFGGKVWFLSILAPAAAATMEQWIRRGYRYLETERLQEAVDLAASFGCQYVALGGYTSILSRDGRALLAPPGVRITSGNSFTVAVAVRRIATACQQQGIDPGGSAGRIGVVGATGNIGSALAEQLVLGPTAARRVLLVGRDTARLERVREQLLRQVDELRLASEQVGGGGPVALDVQTTTDLVRLQSCSIVAIATSTNEPLLYPRHLSAERPVLVADVSVPSALSPRARAMDNVHVIPLAGTVAVPGATDFVNSSHTPVGTAFCCAAEVMLLGLEPQRTAELSLVGKVEQESVQVLDALAEQHGFFTRLAEGGFKGSSW